MKNISRVFKNCDICELLVVPVTFKQTFVVIKVGVPFKSPDNSL